MIQIVTGDFRQLSNELANDSVDLVLTDPPYPREYLPLWGDLARIAARVLKPGGFLVAYSGQVYLDEVMKQLGEHLAYYYLGGLHHNGATKSIPGRGVYSNAMKPWLVYARPPKHRPYKWFIDLLESEAASEEYHKWGQNVGPCRQLVETFSRLGNLVFDPFLGGGTTALACLQTGRDCIGYEINPVTADIARARLT